MMRLRVFKPATSALVLLLLGACSEGEPPLVMSEQPDPREPIMRDCPEPIMSTLEVDGNSTHVFSGPLAGPARDGFFRLSGPNDNEISGPVATTSGSYSVEVPLFCGMQTLELSFVIAGCGHKQIVAVNRTNCVAPDIQVTLIWDATGQDWELHLLKPGGRLNDNATDCTWSSCIMTRPDWGVIGDPTDDPAKDVDNTSIYGLENIVLARPENGTYTIIVEHYGRGAPTADGEVSILIGGRRQVIPITDLPPRFVRVAAQIQWPAGTVTTDTRMHDCNQNWSMGCRDPLP